MLFVCLLFDFTDGYQSYCCSRCAETTATVVASTGHTAVTDPGMAPTCTAYGLTEGSHCADCNAVLIEQKTLPMLAHTYADGQCTVCGEADTTVTPFAEGQSGSFVVAAKVGDIYYAMPNSFPTSAGKLNGTPITVHNGAVAPADAESYVVTLSYSDGTYTLESDGSYLKYSSSTNVSASTETYGWNLAQGINGTWRILTGDSNRALAFRGGEYHTFGAYALSNVTGGSGEYFDLEILPLAEAVPPQVDDAVVLNHNLNLAGDISINFAVRTDLLADYDSFSLKVTIPRYNGNEAEGTTTVEISPVLNGAFYYFTLTGLTAVQMGDTVEAVLHMTKDGEKYISNTDFYSIATYAYAQLNKTTVSQKLRVLCAELLRYGSSAQIFKAYRTDTLVDAAMSAADRSLLRDLETVTFSNNNTILDDLEAPAVTWMGKSLDLDSRVSLKFVVNATNYKGDPQALTLRLTYVNYRGEVQTVTLEDPAIYMEGQPFYAFRFDGLLAAELRCVVDAAVYEGETRVSQTLRYSADTYGNGKTGDLLTLCKALIAYSDTALAFFTN